MKPFALHSVYTDNMIFQRRCPIRIAGTGPAKFAVSVTFAGERLTVDVGDDGEWSVEYPPMEAAVGLTLTAECYQFGVVHTRSNIAVGEVWFCGGQSNMEFLVKGEKFYSLPEGDKVVASAKDPDIRILFVPHALSPEGPCAELPATCRWKLGNDPEAVGRASAVGYYFAQYLRKMTEVPVGIISANWGGCRIEPWIPEKAIMKNKLSLEIAKFASLRGGSYEKEQQKAKAKLVADFDAWLRKFMSTDKATSKKALATWAKPETDTSDWSEVTIEDMPGARKPGVIWYRCEVVLPKNWKANGTIVHADFIDDCDEAFWDGRKIGQTLTDVDNYWSVSRNYVVPAANAKPGKHVVAFRVHNHFNRALVQNPKVASGKDAIMLAGPKCKWFEKVEFHVPADFPTRPLTIYTAGLMAGRFNSDFPASQYNAMLAPATFLHFGGTIWYQGCSNCNEYSYYGKLQKALVEGLREATDSPDMTFIQVELAGFQEHRPTNRLPDDFWEKNEPGDYNLSKMREVQEEIRKIPGCGIASAVDIGDHSDIHPANKREVARRLAAIAGKLRYGEKGVVEGPFFDKAVRDGSRLRIKFTNVGKGLCIKGGRDFGPHAFAIAPAKGKFVWAEAKLDGNEVVVWSDKVANPARVRYAWDPFPPSMRLFNKDGFAATPFRGSVR